MHGWASATHRRRRRRPRLVLHAQSYRLATRVKKVAEPWGTTQGYHVEPVEPSLKPSSPVSTTHHNHHWVDFPRFRAQRLRQRRRRRRLLLLLVPMMDRIDRVEEASRYATITFCFTPYAPCQDELRSCGFWYAARRQGLRPPCGTRPYRSQIAECVASQQRGNCQHTPRPCWLILLLCRAVANPCLAFQSMQPPRPRQGFNRGPDPYHRST